MTAALETSSGALEMKRNSQGKHSEELTTNVTDGKNRRRRLRVALNTKVRVRLKKEFGDGPDIAQLLDASSTGLAFASARQYFLGTELLVTYPYPGDLGLTETARVVRIHKLREGLWRVAASVR